MPKVGDVYSNGVKVGELHSRRFEWESLAAVVGIAAFALASLADGVRRAMLVVPPWWAMLLALGLEVAARRTLRLGRRSARGWAALLIWLLVGGTLVSFAWTMAAVMTGLR